MNRLIHFVSLSFIRPPPRTPPVRLFVCVAALLNACVYIVSVRARAFIFFAGAEAAFGVKSFWQMDSYVSRNGAVPAGGRKEENLILNVINYTTFRNCELANLVFSGQLLLHCVAWKSHFLAVLLRSQRRFLLSFRSELMQHEARWGAENVVGLLCFGSIFSRR